MGGSGEGAQHRSQAPSSAPQLQGLGVPATRLRPAHLPQVQDVLGEAHPPVGGPGQGSSSQRTTVRDA